MQGLNPTCYRHSGSLIPMRCRTKVLMPCSQKMQGWTALSTPMTSALQHLGPIPYTSVHLLVSTCVPTPPTHWSMLQLLSDSTSREIEGVCVAADVCDRAMVRDLAQQWVGHLARIDCCQYNTTGTRQPTDLDVFEVVVRLPWAS